MNFDSRQGLSLSKSGVYMLVNEHLRKRYNEVLNQKTYLMRYFKRCVVDASSSAAQPTYSMHANMLWQMP